MNKKNMNDKQLISGIFKTECHRLKPWQQKIANVLGWFDNALKTTFVRQYGVLQWETDWKPNTITNAGKAQLALLWGDASGVPFTYLALGTSSTAPAATDTTLTAEISDTGLSRAAATFSRVTTTVTNDTAQLTYTWTATGTKTVEEGGVFNAASSGTMFSHFLTTTKSLLNTDNLTVTYQVKMA